MMTAAARIALGLLLPSLPATALAEAPYDVLIKGGLVYDGGGGAPRRVDVGTRGDRIVAIGDLARASARTLVEAKGLAVAPGFINMLSHSEVALLRDGRSQGDIRQGVTTEIFGEGSMGPLSPAMKAYRERRMGDVRYEMPWTTLEEYLLHLEQRGIAPSTWAPSSARPRCASTSSASTTSRPRRRRWPR